MPSKPAPTTYLQLSSESKTIDLVDLLRRLCAEYQYHIRLIHGKLTEMEKFESANSNQRVLKLVEKELERAPVFTGTAVLTNHPFKKPRKEDVVEFCKLPVTRYGFGEVVNPQVVMIDGVERLSMVPQQVTAKDFKYVKTTPEGCPTAANLKEKELRRIYWKLRLKNADLSISVLLGVIIEVLKKQKFAGLRLPNGKVVPFESVHSALFSYVPKELSLFEYSVPGFPIFSSNPPEIIEFHMEMLREPEKDGLFCHHFVMAINLPEQDAAGNLGRLMLIDPTCAQFGMEGINGELLYWGYSEDYVKLFPAREIHFEEAVYYPHNYGNGTDVARMEVLFNLMKGTLENLKLDSCGYCGDVPRKNENGETKLKACSRCRKVYYCDVLCQKMAWKGHKLECKPGSE